MNEKNLKNGEATRFRAGEQQVEIAKKGAEASVKKRKETRTIQQILKTVLDGDVSTLQQFAPLARKLGLESDKSIKEVYTILCLLNSVKTANLGDLEKITKLLGEQVTETSSDEQKQEDAHGELIKALKERRTDEN